MIKEIEIPEGVEVKKEGRDILVKGPKGELRREFSNHNLKIEIEDSKVKVASLNERRKSKAIVGTWSSHIRNMVIGVNKGWEAKLKMVYSHFPIKFSVQEGKAVIQNFLGERKDREVSLLGDVKVEVQKDEVVVTGIDKEHVGQAAASIETAAKVRGFDRRVFQDGFHLIQKCRPIEENS
jgi:large subunit ribosomal protein L6